MLFFNERGELTEGGRTNVFVRIDGRWLTPSLGLRPATRRDARRDAGDTQWSASEAVITRAMLEAANEIVVCNALRGAMRAVLAS